MSRYTDAVAHNLSGLTAVSTGPCPGCEDCAAAWGYASCADDGETVGFDSAYKAGKVEAESQHLIDMG